MGLTPQWVLAVAQVLLGGLNTQGKEGSHLVLEQVSPGGVLTNWLPWCDA